MKYVFIIYIFDVIPVINLPRYLFELCIVWYFYSLLYIFNVISDRVSPTI